MNERIEQLKSQCWVEKCIPHWDNGMWIEKHIDLEKFAELIVRECMDCSTWVGKVNKNAKEPIHTAHAINQRIKQHFGVEE